MYPVLILTLIFFYCSFHFDKLVYKEPFVNVDEEPYQNVGKSSCVKQDDVCMNFKKCCVTKNRAHQCYNPDLVACQKFKLKCESKCEVKKIDDNEQKQDDLQKCMETCKKVESDCCVRLANK